TQVYLATADEVTYYEGGRWPTWADGQGASLELRDPCSNNDTPDAWAASDESAKTTWQQFSFTINGTDSRYTHGSVTVFDVILLDRGEVLLDDLEMIIGSNRVANGGFESGGSGWRILGNHVRSFVTTEDYHSGSHSLHLIATGHGDPGANRINQSIPSVTASTVTFRGWARWLRGTRFLLLRASSPQAPIQPPRPSHAFALSMPLDLGSPGRQNTAFVSNRAPDILEVKHAPVLPADSEPIVVTARVIDNDGVDSVTLRYRAEGDGGFTGMSMVDDGLGDDDVAGDAVFTATIPGVPAGTMMAFYIEASDGSESTRFPTMLQPSADVPNRTCLVRVGDALLDTRLATYRVWLSNDVINTFTSRANLSNELMDCTFVYNDSELYYNCGIRYRGSPFIRGGFGRDPRDRYAYRIDFNPEQKFRDREEINLDHTEDGNRGPLQERASYWFYQQMGLQYSMQEFVRPIINGNNHGAYEDVQKIDGHYIDMWFPDDTEGHIHKIDDYFEYSVDGKSHSNLDEGLKYDSSHPLLKETYRWGFEKRSHREHDNWDHLFEFAVALNTPSSSPTYEETIESVIHPAHFARVLAVRHAVGDWDSYGFDRGKNNYFYYALPEGKWYLLPWDIDFTLGSGRGANENLFSMATNEVPEVWQFVNYPKYQWMYLQAFSDLVHGPWKTSYGTADPPTAFDRFLDDATNALIMDGLGSDRRDGIKAYVRDRRAYILTQIPSFVFEITTKAGLDFCTSDSVVTIKGVASPHVAGIAVNDVPVPVRFLDNDVFEVDIALALGENPLTLEGLDGVGDPLGLTDSVTITRVLPCAVTSVTPSTVRSNSTAQLTIHGSDFEPGSVTSTALTRASDELGFDALYVQSNEAFDLIDAATLLLDDPERGLGDPVYGVHPWINLYSSGTRHGEFPDNETTFAPPFDVDSTNFAVRFTGYIYAPSPGVRYFGVNSDEGFTLSIDGQLVGEFATARPPRGSTTTDVIKNRTAGTMTFDFPAAGRYHLVLDYFENGGGEEIELFQTNSAAGDLRLINLDAELIVYRDNDVTIDGTDVVVVDANSITCDVDLDGAQLGLWNAVLTPPCGEAAQCRLDEAVHLVPASDLNTDSLVNFLDWADLVS
ncbi:MAG: CotH kinase family protein, partial [Phycisphaerales bacterium]